jgi:hypothetical protein
MGVKDRELCRSLRQREMDDDSNASDDDYAIEPEYPADENGVLILDWEPEFAAYNGYSDLRVLKIEDGVDTIEDNVFYGCPNLETVEMGNSVKFIKESAFLYSTKLETIVWSRSLKEIGFRAFRATSIRKLYLPEGLESIGAAAFSECNQLRVARIPDTVKSIRTAAFLNCENLEEISLPTNPEFTTLTNSLLQGCRSLTKLNVPDSVEDIESDALCDCRSLIELTVPNSVTEIQEDALLNCESLRRISLPRNPEYTSLARGIVSDSRSLKTLVLPENISYVDAFSLNAENLLALAVMGPRLSISWDAFNTATQQKESELRIVAYRDTPDNKRMLAPRLMHLPKLQIKGLIQDDGSVKWYRLVSPMKTGIQKEDIARMFPDKRARVLNAMAAATRYTNRNDWPALDEISKNMFPELNELLRFVESFNGSGRVFNMLSPGSWLGEPI